MAKKKKVIKSAPKTRTSAKRRCLDSLVLIRQISMMLDKHYLSVEVSYSKSLDGCAKLQNLVAITVLSNKLEKELIHIVY